MNGYSVKTRIYPISAQDPDPEIIAIAAQTLLMRGLVAFPTETVYGLGANALDNNAVGRIFEVKQRPFYDPLIVHIASKSQIEEVARTIPTIAFELAEQFWPGPLTMVLNRNARVAENVSAGLGTVAVRMPDHRIPLDLIIAAGVPVAAPSANLFSRPSPTIAQHVVDDLFGNVDIILDGGACPIGLESTVLDLTGPIPTILRPGGTPAEALKKVLPDLRVTPENKYADEGSAHPSPGMLLKHYSPKAGFILCTGDSDNVLARMREIILGLTAQGKKIGLMTTDEDYPLFSDLPIEIEKLGSEEDLAEIGQNLFAGMRRLDKQKVSFILMHAVKSGGLGQAIWDRLYKAAEQQVIDLDRPLNTDWISRFVNKPR